MRLYSSLTNHNLEAEILSGQIGVIPTDTIYGLICRALDKEAVGRIYQVRKRDRNKPLVILIASINDLKSFGVVLTDEQQAFLEDNWPGEVSVILPVTKKFDYLSCGSNGLAFRLPSDASKLRELLAVAGPLVAPSANLQGKAPATNVDEAIAYFGDEIDFYVDGGKCDGKPSTLVDYTGIVPKILRQGATEIK